MTRRSRTPAWGKLDKVHYCSICRECRNFRNCEKSCENWSHEKVALEYLLAHLFPLTESLVESYLCNAFLMFETGDLGPDGEYIFCFV